MFEIGNAVKQGQVIAGVVAAPFSPVDRIPELELIRQWFEGFNDPGNRLLPSRNVSNALAILEDIDQ